VKDQLNIKIDIGPNLRKVLLRCAQLRAAVDQYRARVENDLAAQALRVLEFFYVGLADSLGSATGPAAGCAASGCPAAPGPARAPTAPAAG